MFSVPVSVVRPAGLAVARPGQVGRTTFPVDPGEARNTSNHNGSQEGKKDAMWLYHGRFYVFFL
jgi:hypothetical protein